MHLFFANIGKGAMKPDAALDLLRALSNRDEVTLTRKVYLLVHRFTHSHLFLVVDQHLCPLNPCSNGSEVLAIMTTCW